MSARTVYVVDDDREVRSMVGYMLSGAGFEPYPLGSGLDLLETLPSLRPGCILLDVRMPGMDGVTLMRELVSRGIDWPVIFMTGHGEVSIAVEAMKLGAIDFIQKPFAEESLLSRLERAFDLLDKRSEATKRRVAAAERVHQLTSREREVLNWLVNGLTNKLIAERLQISVRTVEMHRSNIMRRLRAETIAQALATASEAGVDRAQG